MQAALIGGRAFFGREIKTEFQRTGTYHILVVSGINVGILAFAVFWCPAQAALGETWATVLTILLSWGYAFIADLGSPIVRATITLDIYLLTRLLFRDRSGLNALGFAALGILLVNPRSAVRRQLPTDVSLRDCSRRNRSARSSAHYLSVARWGSQHRLTRIRFLAAHEAAQFRVELRILRVALEAWLGRSVSNLLVVRSTLFSLAVAELLFISTVIQLALALPMAWYFHRATTMALPANALILPLRRYCYRVLSWPLRSLMFRTGSPLPAIIAERALDALTGTIRIIGHLRISDVRVPTPSLALSIATVVALGLALLVAHRRGLAAAGVAALAMSAAALVFLPPKPQLAPEYSRSRLSTLARATHCC